MSNKYLCSLSIVLGSVLSMNSCEITQEACSQLRMAIEDTGQENLSIDSTQTSNHVDIQSIPQLISTDQNKVILYSPIKTITSLDIQKFITVKILYNIMNRPEQLILDVFNNFPQIISDMYSNEVKEAEIGLKLDYFICQNGVLGNEEITKAASAEASRRAKEIEAFYGSQRLCALNLTFSSVYDILYNMILIEQAKLVISTLQAKEFGSLKSLISLANQIKDESKEEASIEFKYITFKNTEENSNFKSKVEKIINNGNESIDNIKALAEENNIEISSGTVEQSKSKISSKISDIFNLEEGDITIKDNGDNSIVIKVIKITPESSIDYSTAFSMAQEKQANERFSEINNLVNTWIEDHGIKIKRV